MNEFYADEGSMLANPKLEKPIVTEKPWGSETLWAHTNDYVGKILRVHSGEQLSIQYHNFKEETMYVLSGGGFIRFYSLDENKLTVVESKFVVPGDSVHIPPRKIHSVEAVSDMEILEASTNHLDDLVRLQDRYSRK
jgi:mannose-6-phosphate isomerase-like protein (cupin superfamily)